MFFPTNKQFIFFHLILGFQVFCFAALPWTRFDVQRQNDGPSVYSLIATARDDTHEGLIALVDASSLAVRHNNSENTTISEYLFVNTGYFADSISSPNEATFQVTINSDNIDNTLQSLEVNFGNAIPIHMLRHVIPTYCSATYNCHRNRKAFMLQFESGTLRIISYVLPEMDPTQEIVERTETEQVTAFENEEDQRLENGRDAGEDPELVTARFQLTILELRLERLEEERQREAEWLYEAETLRRQFNQQVLENYQQERRIRQEIITLERQRLTQIVEMRERIVVRRRQEEENIEQLRRAIQRAEMLERQRRLQEDERFRQEVEILDQSLRLQTERLRQESRASWAIEQIKREDREITERRAKYEQEKMEIKRRQQEMQKSRCGNVQLLTAIQQKSDEEQDAFFALMAAAKAEQKRAKDAKAKSQEEKGIKESDKKDDA